MASIPAASFNITGTSGSQAALTARSGWFAYVFPRGAWASQDSTGSVIAFDTAAIASRFAANDWIQVGLSTANLRKVNAVGGNSISVQGAAVTVTEDNRVFLIGSTQPTVSGGSATYLVPATVIRHRDDDSSDRYTNSMVTSNADGLIRFHAAHGLYDVLIQDGNQSAQGYIADLAVGVAEGVSTSLASVFGATVTINATLGVTGGVFFTSGGVTISNSDLQVSGGTIWITRANPATNAIGVTGVATFNSRVHFGASFSVDGAIGVTGRATFGNSVTIGGAIGVTGRFTGTSATFTNDIAFRRLLSTQGTTLVAGDFVIGAGWGSTATTTIIAGPTDTAGGIQVEAGGAGIAANPTIVLTYKDGAHAFAPHIMSTRSSAGIGAGDQPTIPFFASSGTTQATFMFAGTPVAGQPYAVRWLIVGDKA